MRNEIMSWEFPVQVYGESVPVLTGYTTLMHADAACTARISATALVGKLVTHLPASNLCECAESLKFEALSSALIELRNLAYRLKRQQDLRVKRAEGLATLEAITSLNSDHPLFKFEKEGFLEEFRSSVEMLPLH